MRAAKRSTAGFISSAPTRAPRSGSGEPHATNRRNRPGTLGVSARCRSHRLDDDPAGQRCRAVHRRHLPRDPRHHGQPGQRAGGHLLGQPRRGQGTVQYLPGDRLHDGAAQCAEIVAIRYPHGGAVPPRHEERAQRLLHSGRHHLCDFAVFLAHAGGAAGVGHPAARGHRRRAAAAGRRHGHRHRGAGHGAVVGLRDRRGAGHQRQGGGRGGQRCRGGGPGADPVDHHRHHRADAGLSVDAPPHRAGQRRAAGPLAGPCHGRGHGHGSHRHLR
ncbi:hypothetical protein D3C87_1389980 [compost metagenome]